MYKLTDAISAGFSLASLQATYINMYMGVILAFLAFMLNNWEKKKHPLAVAFLATGMFLFFASNAYQLYVTQERANRLHAAVQETVMKNLSSVPVELQSVFANNPDLPPAWGLLVLHVLVDVALLAMLIFNYRLNRRSDA